MIICHSFGIIFLFGNMSILSALGREILVTVLGFDVLEPALFSF
jgi:hypothetical protein